MLNKIVIPLLAAITSLIGCQQVQDENKKASNLDAELTKAVLTDSIIYSTQIRRWELSQKSDSASGQTNVWYSIDSTKRANYIKSVFDAVLSGKVNAYMPPTGGASRDEQHKLSIAEVKSMLADSTILYVENPKTGELVETLTVINLNYSDIGVPVFVEEWLYDEATFAITKKVKGLGFSIDRYDEETGKFIGTQIMFYIWLNAAQQTKMSEQDVVVPFIEYATRFRNSTYHNGEIYESVYPFEHVSHENRMRFINSLIDAVRQGEVKAYMTPTGEASNDEQYVLSNSKIESMLVKSTPQYFEDTATGGIRKTMVEVPIDFQGFSQIKFVESWYFNEATLSMKKKVWGIALRLDRHDSNSGEFKGVHDLFWVWFDKDFKLPESGA